VIIMERGLNLALVIFAGWGNHSLPGFTAKRRLAAWA